MARSRRDPRERLSTPKVPGEPVDPVAVGDAAARITADLGLADPRVFTRVDQAWPDLVGDLVAEHSRVRAVRDGALEISVDSPAWATELRYLERELVERVSRLVGAGVVTAIRVSVERA